MNKTIILEGLDRCLKDTMIEKIRSVVPPSHTVHYAKPPSGISNVQQYQKDSFFQMFKMIGFNNLFLPENNATLILNRSHIGEYVYAPMYRQYDGSYVFDLEKRDLELMAGVYLITLVDSNIDAYIKRDDGESFSSGDSDKIKSEIDKFRTATQKSHIKNKKFFDLANYYIDDTRIDDDRLFQDIKSLLKI